MLSPASTHRVIPRQVPRRSFRPTRVVAAVTLEIKKGIQDTLQVEPDPGNGPQNRMFVPTSVWPKVLRHASQWSCHPGGARTLSLLRRSFWWPSMAQDVQEFVAACPTYARGKSSHRPPAFFDHYLFRLVPGPTSRWTSSPASRHWTVTLLF